MPDIDEALAALNRLLEADDPEEALQQARDTYKAARKARQQINAFLKSAQLEWGSEEAAGVRDKFEAGDYDAAVEEARRLAERVATQDIEALVEAKVQERLKALKVEEGVPTAASGSIAEMDVEELKERLKDRRFWLKHRDEILKFLSGG